MNEEPKGNLTRFLDTLAGSTFGITREEAQRRMICIDCKQPPGELTGADASEYRISALCPKCFDKITSPKKQAL